ncbi:MAG TPA: hypothetical protein VJA94_22635 [Candidatus Angelobacter sp.]
MRLRPFVILAIVVCVVIIGVSKLNSSSSVSAIQQNSPPTTPQTMTTSQVESLKDDLNKMRSLVAQMETNLSLVDTTQTPLKHQFQLEIDTWKLMIQRMQKEVQGTR